MILLLPLDLQLKVALYCPSLLLANVSLSKHIPKLYSVYCKFCKPITKRKKCCPRCGWSGTVTLAELDRIQERAWKRRKRKQYEPTYLQSELQFSSVYSAMAVAR